MNSSDELNKLRIAQVAPLWARVPPINYGGAELMVHWLTEELVRLGHEVTLFASGDSETNARLHSVYDFNILEAMQRSNAYHYEYYAAANFAESLRMRAAFDVIHCHVGASMIPFGALSQTPVIHTIHAGLDSSDEHWVLDRYPDVPIAAISRSQIQSVPIERHDNIRVIYHGCDFDAYELSVTPDNYLAFLGRMGPRKNPLGAIKIAKEVGIPIMLAGRPQNAEEKAYFDKEVKPYFDGKNVMYLGPITHAEKVELLKGAGALLFPINWEEHFGLVMIESMACGTPVIAMNRGSVGEVIDNGLTGYYADSMEELVSLVPRVLELDRKAVHKHAMSRFGHERMTLEYADLYESIILRD